MNRIFLVLAFNFLSSLASSCRSQLVETLDPLPEIRQKVSEEVSKLSLQQCLFLEPSAADSYERNLLTYLLAEWSFWERVGLSLDNPQATLTDLVQLMVTVNLMDAFGMSPISFNYILLLQPSEMIPFYTTMIRHIATRQPQGSINNAVVNEAVITAIEANWRTLSLEMRAFRACQVYGATPEECPSDGDFSGTWYDAYDLVMYGPSYSDRWQKALRDFMAVFMDDPSKADAQDPTTMPNIPISVLQEWTLHLQLDENIYAKKAFAIVLNFFNPWFWMAQYYSPFKTMGPFVVRLLIARDGLNEFTPELYFLDLNHMLLSFLVVRDQYREANKDNPSYEPSLGDCLLLVPGEREDFLKIVLDKRGVPALAVHKNIIRYRQLRMLIEEYQRAVRSQDAKANSKKVHFNSKGERALYTDPFNDGEEAGFFATEEETISTADFHHFMRPSRAARRFRPPYVDRDPDSDNPTPWLPTSSSLSPQEVSEVNTKHTSVAGTFSELSIHEDGLPRIEIPARNLRNLSKKRKNVPSRNHNSSDSDITMAIIFGFSVFGVVLCVLGLIWAFRS